MEDVIRTVSKRMTELTRSNCQTVKTFPLKIIIFCHDIHISDRNIKLLKNIWCIVTQKYFILFLCPVSKPSAVRPYLRLEAVLYFGKCQQFLWQTYHKKWQMNGNVLSSSLPWIICKRVKVSYPSKRRPFIRTNLTVIITRNKRILKHQSRKLSTNLISSAVKYLAVSKHVNSDREFLCDSHNFTFPSS